MSTNVFVIVALSFPALMNCALLIPMRIRQRRWTLFTGIQSVSIGFYLLFIMEVLWLLARYPSHEAAPLSGTAWIAVAFLLIMYGVIIFWMVRLQWATYRSVAQAPTGPPKHDQPRRRVGPTRRRQRVAQLRRAYRSLETMGDSDG